MILPAKIKENKTKNSQTIEFGKIRTIKNQYRDIVSELNQE